MHISGCFLSPPRKDTNSAHCLKVSESLNSVFRPGVNCGYEVYFCTILSQGCQFMWLLTVLIVFTGFVGGLVNCQYVAIANQMNTISD